MDPRILAAEEAVRVETLVHPFVDKAIADLLDRMEAQYGNPEATMEVFYGLVAELCALRNLRKEFNVRRRNGVRALKQETQHVET